MFIQTNLNDQPIRLNWNIENKPENYRISIVDVSHNKIIDLATPEYIIENQFEEYPIKFQVIIGSQEFVSTSLMEVQGQIPTQISLDQNYPNPFNPSTKIGYKINKSSKVNIVIYNSLGQKVKDLMFQQVHDPGEYLIEWDGKNIHGNLVSSGVYIYQLQTDNIRKSKKMILLR